VDSEIFLGNALSAVDGKSRLSIPAFIRNALIPAEPRHVYIGLHSRAPCLTVYGDSYAAYQVEELRRIRIKSEDDPAALDRADDRERGLFGGGRLVCDSGGRVVLSGPLRKFGRIDDKAMFIGHGDYAEVWNPKVALEVGGEKLKLYASYYLDGGDA
jgi:MraZ protein